MISNFKTISLKVKDVLDERKFAIPRIQRNLVWKKERKLAFIDNVRKGDPFGVMLIRDINGVYEIIDGLQRITTIKDYYNNKFDYVTSDILNKDLIKEILVQNLIAQGVNPDTQDNNYYDENIKKLSLMIYDLLKLKKEEMEIICEVVSDMGLSPNNQKIMQGIVNVCKKFESDTNIDDLEVTAINYVGPSENIPTIFYNLNTGAVTLSKYETYSALWSNTNYLITDEEIIKKVINKYQSLSDESELEVEFDEDNIRTNGISLFEYCFALGQIIKEKEVNYGFISKNFINNPSKTDPSGFELLALIFNQPINKAEKLLDFLGTCTPKFLESLKTILCESLDVVFDCLKFYSIGLNGSSLFTDSDYLLYHIVISYIKEYYLIDYQTNSVSKINPTDQNLSKGNFKKYMPFVYLHDTFTDFWKINRQVADLSEHIGNAERRHRYWNRISDDEWRSCFTHLFSIQKDSPKAISKNNKLFIDLYTKLNLEFNYPIQMTKFKKFIDDNKKDIKLDYEHITPKKRIESKLGSKQSAIAISRIGNLCYLSIADNRSKGKKTIYEFLNDRPALDIKDEYLNAVDYPSINEIDFLDCNVDEFIKGFDKLIKERENRLEKNMYELIKKKVNSL